MMRTFLCLLAVISLTACKSTSSLESINTGVDSSWKGDQKYQVLIASRLFSAQLRELFENEMTLALRAEGVNAVPSYAILPDVAMINQETIAAIMSRGQDVALLFTEATAVNRSETSSGTEGGSVFSQLMGADSTAWETKFTAMMESGLYIHGQDAAVWWKRTKLEAEETASREAATRFVKDEVKAMKKAGVIDRLN